MLFSVTPPQPPDQPQPASTRKQKKKKKKKGKNKTETDADKHQQVGSLASFPGSLIQLFVAFRTASDEKLDESLGTRLRAPYLTVFITAVRCIPSHAPRVVTTWILPLEK